MYSNTARKYSSSAASSLLRASSSVTRPLASTSTAAHAPCRAGAAGVASGNQQRYSSTLRSLRCSVPRWSHGVDWKSPISLTAQIRTAAPALNGFHRKLATMAAENPFKGILTGLPKPGGGEFGKFYSLPALNDPRIDKLPYSIRILLESAIRNCDNFQVKKEDVEKIIDWENSAPKLVEIPFKPARVLLQDFTGVPAVVDLACMRDAMNNLGSDSDKINPLVPVDLVIDHSVQVDVTRSENAVQANMELEFQRNKERFAFLKWGSNAFQNMLVVPPGSGIVHQVNLEYLGRVVFNREGLLYPDSVVGTDSHTTMIDGLGVAGWGVGGIEAEAAMLGQPMSMVLPGVVGFKLSGNLRNGVTATDLVLTVTQMLRKHGVVGKFVEFYGEGMSGLSLADRATIANMAPEYGATMGFFPNKRRRRRKEIVQQTPTNSSAAGGGNDEFGSENQGAVKTKELKQILTSLLLLEEQEKSEFAKEEEEDKHLLEANHKKTTKVMWDYYSNVQQHHSDLQQLDGVRKRKGRGNSAALTATACALASAAAEEEVVSTNKSTDKGAPHRRLWVKNRSKAWWDQCNSPDFPEEEFKKAFRMGKDTFELICNELTSVVAKENTMLRDAVPVKQRVAVCIWRLATGEPLSLFSI